MARVDEGQPRVGLGRHPLGNIYIKFASNGNEFQDFSAWTPLSHFVIQR